jgi:serine/threonine protein kinase
VVNSVTSSLASWGTLLAIDAPQTAAPEQRSLSTLPGLSVQGHGLHSWNGDIADSVRSGNGSPFVGAIPGVLPTDTSALTPDLANSLFNDDRYLHWAALPDRGFFAARPQTAASLIRLQPAMPQGVLVFQRQTTGLSSSTVRSLAATAQGSLWRTEELSTSQAALVGPDDIQRDSFTVPFAAPLNGVDGRLAQAVHFDSISAMSLIGFGDGDVLRFRQYRIAEPTVPLFDTLPAVDGVMIRIGEAGGIYNLPSHLSPGARDLIPRMLLVDPLKRITIPEIRQHPWFMLHRPRYLAVMQVKGNGGGGQGGGGEEGEC